MLIHLKNVLGPHELSKIRELLDNADFVDGKLSAGRVASQVKLNQEVSQNDAVLQTLNQIVMGNLLRHKLYQRAALPLKIASPFYACYRQGMRYGEHIDDPVMGPSTHPGQRYRSDLALTLFLNAPEEYQGGELSIHTEFGEQQFKYPAGDAVMYPATTRHQVREVTSGVRLVAVTWIQSMIKDAELRSILFHLGSARDRLLRKQAEQEYTKQVDLAYVNLLRRFSEL